MAIGCDWLKHLARFGFDEWHSNFYYPLDAKPLLTLVEFANDREVNTKSAMILDRLLFDLALHIFRGPPSEVALKEVRRAAGASTPVDRGASE